MAESQLIEAMKRGEPWAIKLLLMTKGKRRGYSLRFEHTGEDGSPIQARFIAPKRFETAEDWQRYAQASPRVCQGSVVEKSACCPKPEEDK